MQITLAKNAGFCPGVKRATDFVEDLLQKEDKNTHRLYTLGTLIHNPVYTKELAEQGVRSVTLDEMRTILEKRDGYRHTLVIRTHGIPREQEEILRAYEKQYPDFTVKDMTCPYVKRIHRIADEETSESTVFLLLGSPEHPEVQGIMSYVHGDGFVFNSCEELKKLCISMNFVQKKVLLAAQTTQSLTELKKCRKFLEKLYTNALFFGTICSVTEKRQTEAALLAKQCDGMIVIGGKESSNTHKLFELCKTACPRTVWIERAEELSSPVFSGTVNLGITAGASTPDRIIMEVYKTMSKETQDFAQMLEESFKSLHTGETVTGTVMAVSANEIKLDLGAKVTGIIPRDQITDDPAASLAEMFKIGDEVTAFVIHVDDNKGVASLSKKRVDADRHWLTLMQLYNDGSILEGKIVDAVKGGLLIALDGVRAFIPASHSGLPRNADLTSLVGTTQRVRLIEMDQNRKRALASIRVILNEERKEKEAAFWSEIEVGKHYLGKVKNMTTYGAFVDLGGVDGMVHKDELSWRPIRHPSAVVSVGQELDVYVKEFDAEAKRISLGYKSEENDMWRQFTKQYEVGNVVEAKIVSILPFGAFAEVFEGVDGLIHISQIALTKIANPANVLNIGDTVTVKITKIDDEKRELSLSIRALLEEERRAQKQAEKEAEMKEEEARRAEEEAEYAPYIVRTID